ncbi:MAG: shikimate dehydrogenase [Candidatus Bathyarchaeota archaeon]
MSSATKLYAVIGDPVEHSLSPVMQNVAFQSLDLNSIYLAFKVTSNNLENAIIGMKSLGILGFNVTVPHKVSVMKYLDEVDPQAVEVGAVNTVVNKEGILKGYNTDGAGALAALREAGVKIEGQKVVLLGAGGAAKALAYNVASLAESLIIFNRTESKAKNLATSLTERLGFKVEGKEITDIVLCSSLRDADILINATSVGMYPRINETPLQSQDFHSGMTVFDIVYNPLLTRLLREAKAAGAHSIGGVKMLVYQGALAFELWTGRKPPIKKMCDAVEKVLKRE